MPVFNREHTLKRAIACVLGQTCADLELLICDDASSDGSVAVVEAVQDPRVRLLRHEVNRGPAAARNTAVAAATAEYLAFLDSDDEWHPEKLQKQVRILDNLAGDYGMVLCGVRVRKVNEGSEILFVPRYEGDVYKRMLKNRLGVPTSSVMVRTDRVREAGGFDERLRRCEDIELWMRVLARCKLARCPECLATFNIVLGKRVARQTEEAVTYIVAKHREEFRRVLGPRGMRRACGNWWLIVARLYVQEGQFAKGFTYLWKALAATPLLPFRSYLSLAGAFVRFLRMRRRSDLYPLRDEQPLAGGKRKA